MKKRIKADDEDTRARTERLLGETEITFWVPGQEKPYRCRSVDEADHFVERVEEVYGQIDGIVEWDARECAGTRVA